MLDAIMPKIHPSPLIPQRLGFAAPLACHRLTRCAGLPFADTAMAAPRFHVHDSASGYAGISAAMPSTGDASSGAGDRKISGAGYAPVMDRDGNVLPPIASQFKTVAGSDISDIPFKVRRCLSPLAVPDRSLTDLLCLLCVVLCLSTATFGPVTRRRI